MTAYLLDTGLVLRHLRGHQRTVQLLRGLGKMGRLSIASVTRLEVHAGMLPEERYPTQKLLARLATIGLDREISDRAGDMIAASRSANKVLAVPDGDPLWREAKDLDDVPEHLLRELEHFFAVYKELEKKKTATLGWRSATEAMETIERAQAAARAK